MTFQQAEYMQGSNTGESSRPRLSSRNAYVESGDEDSSHGPEHSHDGGPCIADDRCYAPAGHAAYHDTDETSYPDSYPYSYSPGGPASLEPPALPARPDDPSACQWSHIPPRRAGGESPPGPGRSQHRPDLPPRPPAGRVDRHHDPRPPGRTDEPVLPPPRRRLTTGDIPVAAVGYARDPERLIAYLIPLPPPSSGGQTLGVPQRYMLYTPPAPDLVKPAPAAAADGSKEGRRHRARRLVQAEVRKAKTYGGAALTLRGLHYKGLRGCDRAVAAVRGPDVTFLNRVPRARVAELVLVHPASVLAGRGPGGVRDEVGAQLARARRRAARDSVVSTLLFPPSLVVDTLAAVVWPFGGLAEIDGVWMYASISGYLTARSVTRRMEWEPAGGADGVREGGGQGGPARRRLSPVSEEDIYLAGIETTSPRGDGRHVHFEELLEEEEEEEEDLKRAAGNGGKVSQKKKPLKVVMAPDDAMDTMASYFQEVCHQRNPEAFGSPGVPPTKTDVLASIGWWPDRRGRAPGVEHPGDWEDENWQTRQVKEDLDRVFTKAAKSWDKWCKSYAKYPERALNEKGHSRTSDVLRKLRIRRDTRGPRVVV